MQKQSGYNLFPLDVFVLSNFSTEISVPAGKHTYVVIPSSFYSDDS